MKTPRPQSTGGHACASGTLTALASLPLAAVAATINGTGSIPAWLRSRTGRAARLLLLLLWTLAATLQAQEYSFTTTDGTITITGYTGPGGVVTIPETINGLPVASIGDRTFHNCTNLTSIRLPESVTNISSYAFAYCYSLTRVTLPSSMIWIGDGAFYCCWGLTSATIPDGVISIGDYAFAGCGLTSVVIPKSVTSIGESAFFSRSLLGIMVDAGNTFFCSVDDVLFDKNQTTLLQCPAGKTESYIIPTSVTSIGNSAFESCSSLTNVTIPNSVTSIGDQAFYSCESLTEVTIPNSVTSIGNLAFVACTGLTSVTIPSSVTNIGGSAFNSCSSLTSISIPDSVTSIGSSAFTSCPRLVAITVGPFNTAYSSLDGVLFNKSQTVLIQCPGVKAGSYAIPDSVTTIGDSAFAGCSSLTNLTIPNSVTSIGYGAFEGCGSLTIVLLSRAQPAAHPLVKEMLRDIQSADLYSLMRQITGEEPVFVGNEAVVFTSRLTGSAPLRKATQFAFEQLQALGLQVQYQAWASGPTYSDRNIIGIQPGVSRPEEIVVICAHFDDYSETSRAPGADDNGSGSAAVLTAARICSQYRFERTIHYVLFTGEEQHGLGSQEYVSQAVAGGSNIVAVLAPDMIGYASSALEPPTCSLTTWFTPDLGFERRSEIEAMFTLGFEVQAMFTNVVGMYGLSNTLSCSFAHPGLFGVPSDAEFFFEHRYPTLFLTHAHENSRIHSAKDALDALNFSYFTAMVQAIVGTAAHLAYPTNRNPFEVIEVVNSDWTPASDLGGGNFYATFAFGASETNVDLHDLPWSKPPTNSPFNKELRIYSDPFGVPLQIDTRPAGSDTLFRVKLAVADATAAGVSVNTRLRFSPLTPTGSNRIYLVRVHVDGRYLVTGRDFDCVTNLHEVVSAGGFLDLPSLVQVPDGAVYGTCDLSARLLNQDAASCRLRVVSLDSPSIVLSSTAQMGAHIMDDLEVCTNLAPPIKWTLLKSYTNVVSPDATHFESGWTEVVREVDPSLLPEGTLHFFRLKRTWTN